MITLTMLHQKGTLSFEKDHGHNRNGGSLCDRTHTGRNAKPWLFKNQDIELKALNNAHEEKEVVLFDSGSINLYT